MTLEKIVIQRPDDWHLHLRDGAMMRAVLPFSSRDYGRAVIMPNLVPPLQTSSAVQAYRERIMAVCPPAHQFTPLMTLYLTDQTDIQDLIQGYRQNIIFAVKLYPANATTNSAHGVSALKHIMPVLEAMEKEGIPLLIHGEVTDSDVDVFDRESFFIDRTLIGLLNRFPELKIVLEHATTKEAAQLVLEGPETLAASITPQHILLNRNALFKDGLRPHHYCLPVLKREQHRAALMEAVTSGCHRFFPGTDSAPHEQKRKEGGCGCAGIFNAMTALGVYATVFETAGAMDRFEAFVSINGPTFYNLGVNTEQITLLKKDFQVPEFVNVPGVGRLIPFMAGETIHWCVA